MVMCLARAFCPREAAGRVGGRRRFLSVCHDRSGNRVQARLQVKPTDQCPGLATDTSVPGYFRMLTARATISATVTMETTDCRVMASLAQRDSGITSVGLNAAALVNARYR